MEQQTMVQQLQAAFPKSELKLEECEGDPAVLVPPEDIPSICRYLRDTPELEFNYLCSISGVDLQDQLAVVYHMQSLKHRHLMALKTLLDRNAPSVATVTEIWPAANWFEREIYDLFGVTFDRHPDLRRIMMPDDWQGHPLRRDYQEGNHYHGVPTTRPDPLALVRHLDKPPPKPEPQPEGGAEEEQAGGDKQSTPAEAR